MRRDATTNRAFHELDGSRPAAPPPRRGGRAAPEITIIALNTSMLCAVAYVEYELLMRAPASAPRP